MADLNVFFQTFFFFFLRGEILIDAWSPSGGRRIVSDSYRLKPHGGRHDACQECPGAFHSIYFRDTPSSSSPFVVVGGILIKFGSAGGNPPNAVFPGPSCESEVGGPDPQSASSYAALFYDGGSGGAAVSQRRIGSLRRATLTGSPLFSLFFSACSFASITCSQ
jgi:hypothetical protein